MSNSSCSVYNFPTYQFEITWLIFINHKNNDTFECGQWEDGTWGARLYAKSLDSLNDLINQARTQLENQQKKQKAAASSKRQKF